MQNEAQVLIQAYCWTSICDSQLDDSVKLKADLALAMTELKRAQDQYASALWVMHELSNRAAHAAIMLYTARQLQERFAYDTRNHLQALLWAAEAAMDFSDASRQYPHDPTAVPGDLCEVHLNFVFVVNLDLPVCAVLALIQGLAVSLIHPVPDWMNQS